MKTIVKIIPILILGSLFSLMNLQADDFPPMQNYNQPESTMSGSTSNKDATVSERVKEALANSPKLSNDARNISVSVTDSNVTLFGKVKSNNEKSEVINMVNKVKGVNRVTDKLEITNER